MAEARWAIDVDNRILVRGRCARSHCDDPPVVEDGSIDSEAVSGSLRPLDKLDIKAEAGSSGVSFPENAPGDVVER